MPTAQQVNRAAKLRDRRPYTCFRTLNRGERCSSLSAMLCHALGCDSVPSVPSGYQHDSKACMIVLIWCTTCRYKGNFELTYVSKSTVVVKAMSTGSRTLVSSGESSHLYARWGVAQEALCNANCNIINCVTCRRQQTVYCVCAVPCSVWV